MEKEIALIAAVAIPSVIIFVVAQLIAKTTIQKETIKCEGEVAKEKIGIMFPLQLQAYERLCMLLERISPDNLVIRKNAAGLTVMDFQQILFAEINNEYTHNISQQVYVSTKAWANVKKAVELLKMNINKSAAELRGQEVAVSTDLAKKILENAMREQNDPIQEALTLLRKEVKML